MDVISVGILLILVSNFHIKKLKKQSNKKELYVFLVLMAIASYLSLGLLLEIYIPNPTNGLRVIFAPINEWFYQLMS